MYATAFKLTDQEVVDFGSRVAPPVVPGVPKLSPDNIIDGGRAMTFYRQIPSSSAGRRFEVRSRIVGVYDKGKLGTIVEDEKILVDAVSGEEYVKQVGNTFHMGQGNWGGPKGMTMSKALCLPLANVDQGPAPKNYPAPKKEPDFTYSFKTTAQAALFYRYVPSKTCNITGQGLTHDVLQFER